MQRSAFQEVWAYFKGHKRELSSEENEFVDQWLANRWETTASFTAVIGLLLQPLVILAAFVVARPNFQWPLVMGAFCDVAGLLYLAFLSEKNGH